MKKRLLSFLMTAVMCLTLLPVPAQAYQEVPVIAVDMSMPKALDKPEDMTFTVNSAHKGEYRFYYEISGPRWYEDNPDYVGFRDPYFYGGKQYHAVIFLVMEKGYRLPVLPTNREPTPEEVAAFAEQVTLDLGSGPLPIENHVLKYEDLTNGKYMVEPFQRVGDGQWVLKIQYYLALPMQEGLQFNEKSFPDYMLRKKLEEVLPPEVIQDHFLTEEELASVTSLDLSHSGTKDLTGLEYFKNLEDLNFSECSVKTADLRGMPKLKRVVCSGNTDMRELDVTGNPELTTLECGNSRLKHLDVSRNPELTELICPQSNLEELDVSRNPKLRKLVVHSNGLMVLDVRANTQLKWFSAESQNRAVFDGDFLSKYGLRDMSRFKRNGDGEMARIENGRINFIDDYLTYSYYCGEGDYGYPQKLYCSLRCQHQQEPYDLPGYRIWNESFESDDMPEGWKVENKSKYYQVIAPRFSKNTHHGFYTMTSTNMGSPHALIYTPEIEVGKGYHLTFSFTIDDDGAYITPERTEHLKTYVQVEGQQPVQIGENYEAWTSWQTATLNLSQYEGKKVRVIFEHENEFSQTMLLRLDCVELWSDALELNDRSFPDRNLLNVVRGYDRNGDGLLDKGEESALTELDLKDSAVTDFTGISHLKHLQKLAVDGTGAEELDLSGNTALKSLTATNCPKLKKLNVSGCTQLEELTCKNSGVEVLEVFDCTGLRSLDCSDTPVTELELETCGQLEKLYCNNSRLAALDLENKPNLTVFEYSGWEREVEQNSPVFRLLELEENRVSDVKGGVLKDGLILFDAGSAAITYTYDCGGGKTAQAKLVRDPSTIPSFRDVKPDDWFYGGVMYVTERGLFKGISSTEFAPRIPMTRSMVVQVLYSMAGKPVVEKTDQFVDVKDSDWFADAVAWGVENGVTSGYPGGRFAPNDNVNREQLAVMLHGYMKKPEATQPLNFADVGDISDWAEDAMQWAVENKLMSGVPGNKIMPKGPAERSQGAVIMMNFDQMPKPK